MQHPTTKPDSPFNRLIADLQAMRDARTVRENARQARIAQEAARNRRLQHVQRQQVKRRVMAKAAPVDFDRLAAQQAQLETAMQAQQARAKTAHVRDCLADLAADAKAGRLSANDAALFDVLKNRAAALGVTP